MRFLFFTDTHIRSTTPSSRKDDFFESMKIKFNEVIDISNKYHVDYILHGGDLFDRPDVSVKVVSEIARILMNFKKKIFMVIGNHDVYGHNPKTIDRTMLGLLSSLGVIDIIDTNRPIVLSDDNLKVQISGSSYIYDIDGKDKSHYYPSRMGNVDCHILLIHSFLLSKPFIESIQHTLIENIIDTDANIVLSGHYHTGFGVKRINDKYFVNPGSLSRISNTTLELSRIPKVAILDIDINGEINVELIPLSSAQLGSDIFIEKETFEKVNISSSIEQLKQVIRSNINTEYYDIVSIIKDLADTKNLPDDIVMEAIKRLGDVHEKDI